MARIRASDSGLSTTTTSSGLFHEFRLIRRGADQSPRAVFDRDPDAVDGDELADRLPGERLAPRLHRPEALDDAVGDFVFDLVAAMRRHRRRAPGLGQIAIEIGHRLSGVAVEHIEDRDRSDEAVVVAPTARRVEEEMPRFLEARERVQIPHSPLDMRMAGLPEVDPDAIGAKPGIARTQPGRLAVDEEEI